MNEIKFRAWHKERKHYLEVEKISFDTREVQVLKIREYRDEVSFNEVILEQYTGLNDENGNEIYEGDIVDITYMGKQFQGSVQYNKGCASFEVLLPKFTLLIIEIDNLDKIIGNIHEGVKE